MRQIYAENREKGLAPIFMGKTQILKRIDNENLRVSVEIRIGDYETTKSSFSVEGTLNVATNTFHWGSESQIIEDNYLEGYDIDIASKIESN